MALIDPNAMDRELGPVLMRLRPAVQGFFARRVGSPSEAEDLTQEVMARILNRAENGPIGNIDGYVFHAAANLLRERGRQAALRRSAQLIELGPELSADAEARTPERIALGRDTLKQVIKALYELPERTRTVFILNRFEDMSAAEIAGRLEVSVSAVEKHMMRALAHLRSCMR